VSALPFETTPSPPATASAADHSAGPRHLHAVPRDTESPAEITTEFAPVGADPADDTETISVDPAGGAATWMRTVFVPDSGLYVDRQPSIAETVRRARHGRQLADRGALRGLGVAHGYLAAANKAVAHTWVWIVDHPARLVTFVALLGLAIMFPPTRHLIAMLLTPIAWVQHALD
jgi:hypothetical protein